MSRRERDPFELVLLCGFVAVCAWTLGYNLWQVLAHGARWTGVDGLFPGDQLQYLAWIRDASRHLLASDLFVLRPTPHDYAQPVVQIAALLTAAGIPPWLAYLLLQPLAVLAVFIAVATLLRRTLEAGWPRRAALVLALFYGSFGLLLDEWIPFWTWGYLPGALAIAALAGALTAYEEHLKSGRRPWLAPLLAFSGSWLHPWQGEEVILIVLSVLAVQLLLAARRGSPAPPWRPAAWTIGAAALPLAYYGVLDRADPIWRMAEVNGALHWPFWLVARGLLPLAAVACLGWFGQQRTFLELAIRAWPVAALVVYALGQAGLGAGPLHAFAGISIPLAVLAVQGVRRAGFERLPAHPWLAAALVAAATVPASLYMLRSTHWYISPSAGAPNFIAAGDQQALDYLAHDPRPGGVLTSINVGADVPAVTGRNTYVGNCFWSLPDCGGRQSAVGRLLDGPLSASEAIALVRGTGASFVLAPCGSVASLAQELGTAVETIHRFGCAAVYDMVEPRR